MRVGWVVGTDRVWRVGKGEGGEGDGEGEGWVGTDRVWKVGSERSEKW